jgi:WD40 repeat protein
MMPHFIFSLSLACLAAASRPAAADEPAALDKPAVDRDGDPLPDGAVARLGTSRWRPGGYGARLAISPDGSLLASAGTDGALRLWETDTGKEVRVCWGHRGYVWSAAFSPDGKKLVSGGADQTVRVWDVASGEEIQKHRCGPGPVQCVTFGRGGDSVLYTALASTVMRWDPETGKETKVSGPNGWDRTRNAIALEGEQIVLTGVDALALNDLAAAKEVCSVAVPARCAGLAFSPDRGTAVIQDFDAKAMILRDVGTGKELQRLEGSQLSMQSVVFSPDGRFLFGCGADLVIRRWEVKTGKMFSLGSGNQGYLSTLAFASDGKTVLTSGLDRFVHVWDAATGKEVSTFEGGKGTGAVAAALSADGKSVAASFTNGEIHVWDADSGRSVLKFKAPEKPASVLAFSQDGATLFGTCFEPAIRRWDVKTGEEKSALKGHEKRADSLDSSRDGKLIVSGSDDNTVRLWDAAEGKELCVLRGHKIRPSAAVFSPDGRTVASRAYDGTVRLWEADGGKEVRRWEASNGNSLSFSADGRFLAGDVGQTVRVWETATGREALALTGHRGPVWRVAFSPDGKRLASAGYDTTVLVWDAERLLGKGPPQRLELSAGELKTRWEDLGAPDDPTADYAAVVLRAAAPQMIAFAKDRLREPVREEQDVARIADLGAEDPAKRGKAFKELAERGPAAGPALRQALDDQKDPDVRLRISLLQGRLEKPDPAEEKLRAKRAVRVLEHVGTKKSRELLEFIAKGAADSPWTIEAKVSLDRPDAKDAPKP